MAQWPAELLAWCGVATHVHSDFPHNPTCAGTQSVAQVAVMAESLGFEGVAFAEHTTDPAMPQNLTDGSAEERDAMLGFVHEASSVVDNTDAELMEAGSNLWLFSGVEANIMADGSLDVPADELASRVRYVVASQHGGLGTAEKDPVAIAVRLIKACLDPNIHTIGHPSRYNDDIRVDWPVIFGLAAHTNTAIEMNFNLWFSKGPGRGRRIVRDDHWFDYQLGFWDTWVGQLADSGAPIAIGLDIHNAGMWPTDNPPEEWSPSIEHLAAFIELLSSNKVAEGRVINSTAERFMDWISVPKTGRHISVA